MITFSFILVNLVYTRQLFNYLNTIIAYFLKIVNSNKKEAPMEEGLLNQRDVQSMTTRLL